MSNGAVGPVYKRIIDAVIEQSRADFEENGVQASVLQALQDDWQERLSASQRALFPWDPQPSEEPVASEPTPGPSIATDGARPTPTPTSGRDSAQPSPSPMTANGNSSIKQEPAQTDSNYLTLPQTGSQPNSASVTNPQYASQRAQQQLQQKFGSQASGSIGAIQAAYQSSSATPRASGQADGSSAAGSQASDVKRENGAVKQEDITTSQTDGAGDDVDLSNALLIRRDADGNHQSSLHVTIDRPLRHHVEAMGRRLEAGGLMIPLEDRQPVRLGKRKQMASSDQRSSTCAASSLPARGGAQLSGQLDGVDGSSPMVDDDLDDDDDAINSELDDPDDGLDNIEAGFDGDVILCLYDKVQRVKNKWKCTLKDGVVTVNGKDYVFHKAQGEFEW